MQTAITRGVLITVESHYRKEFSNPLQNEFVFAYKVRIENKSNEEIQLLRRHWFIFDSNGMKREIKGEGVLGRQPVLSPGGFHEYVSGCHLNTGMGRLYGTYTMQSQNDGSTFNVLIPSFVLEAPMMLN